MLGLWFIPVLLAFASTDKERFDIELREGLLALTRGEAPAAQKHLKAATDLDARNGAAWLALAQAYARTGNRAEADQSARKAFDVASGDPRVLHGLTLYYVDKGDAATAADMEARYAKLASSDTEAYRRAASLYLTAGKAEVALESALAAVKAEDNAAAHNVLGKAYEAVGQTDKAVLELQQAIRKSEFEESYYFDLANVLLQHQNFDAVIQLIEASRRIFARSAQLELVLGVAYYGQRRFGEAVGSFLRTIAIDRSVAQPYVFLGRILEHAGDRLPEIIERFRARAAAMPKDFMAQHLYGKALAASGGETANAEAALRSSIALRNDFWESHYELGLLFEKERNFEGAAKELERSIALNPNAPAPHYRLARVYDRLGRREDAAGERSLHEKLTAEEKVAMEKHVSGVKRLELVIK